MSYCTSDILSFTKKDTRRCIEGEDKAAKEKELSLMMMTRNREDVTELPTSFPLFEDENVMCDDRGFDSLSHFFSPFH